MNIKLDRDKLAALIAELIDDTHGCCTGSGVCIGRIDGKEVQLMIQADRNAFIDSPKRFACVKKAKP